jgi:type IV secretion system protein TrbJ
MKLNMTNQKKYLIVGSLVLATATPSFALFGVGDIVFDPTSYASLVSQATTALNQLKTIQNNVEHFSIKQQWQTALTKLENMNVASMFGETAGINIALNANSPTASVTGWKTATMPMNSGTASYLQAQNANSSQRAQLAMIETSDAISPDCLTAVGTYRSGRNQNSNANSLLAQQQLDITSSTNSEVEQLNLLNAAEAQRMSEMQSQGTLQACLAAQMTVANMQQRNAAVQDLNTAAAVQQQRSTNDTSAANESNTWQTYPRRQADSFSRRGNDRTPSDRRRVRQSGRYGSGRSSRAPAGPGTRATGGRAPAAGARRADLCPRAQL